MYANHLRSSLLLLCFFLALPASAATLSLTGASGVIGQTISVSVLVSAQGGESLNGVSANIEYPPDKLTLLSMSKAGSIVTFWAEEPSFSNSAGVASIEGIIPNPGYSGQGGRVITLVFQVKAPGSATLSFSGASVLANDGLGTNILRSASSRTLSLSAAETSAPSPDIEPVQVVRPEPDEEAVKLTPPAESAFPIRSETHPDQSGWYKSTDGVFSWDVPGGATATRLLFDTEPSSVPSIVYEPAIGNKAISGIAEGTSYLHVQHRVNGEWGGIGHYRVNVDTTPPNDFKVTFPHGDTTINPQPVILFNTTDGESGIDKYEIRVGSDRKGALAFAPTADSNPYALPLQEPGSHVVTVTAYDRAGNSALAVAGFYIEGIDPPVISYYTEEIKAGDLMKFIGNTYENSIVTVYVYRNGEKYAEDVTRSSSIGNFTLVFTKRLPPGTYTATAKVVDARGATSPESEPVTFVVEGNVLDWIAGNIFFTLVILLALVSVGVIAYSCIYGWHRLLSFSFIRRLAPQDLVHRSFSILKRDLSSHIAHLKQEPDTRLTKKEIAFLEQFEQDLEDMESIVESKVKRQK